MKKISGKPKRGGGHSAPDLLITGGQILNVYTGEILPSDVVIHGPLIRYVGPPAISWTRPSPAGERSLSPSGTDGFSPTSIRMSSKCV